MMAKHDSVVLKKLVHDVPQQYLIGPAIPSRGNDKVIRIVLSFGAKESGSRGSLKILAVADRFPLFVSTENLFGSLNEHDRA